MEIHLCLWDYPKILTLADAPRSPASYRLGSKPIKSTASQVTQKEVIKMIKVSIEVHSGTARFAVSVLTQSVQRALSLVAARYPESVVTVKFPIDSESIFAEDSAA
jgi:hypothetical protein